MKLIDEMLALDLIAADQHRDIAEWVAKSGTPDEILQMPAELWEAVTRASQVMGVDSDLERLPPMFSGDALDI